MKQVQSGVVKSWRSQTSGNWTAKEICPFLSRFLLTAFPITTTFHTCNQIQNPTVHICVMKLKSIVTVGLEYLNHCNETWHMLVLGEATQNSKVKVRTQMLSVDFPNIYDISYIKTCAITLFLSLSLLWLLMPLFL